MSKIKPKRIVKHGCYSASNRDLGIKDRNGEYMKGEHDVFVIEINKNGFVKVKTITSIENSNTGTVQQKSLKNIKNGRVIPIPDKILNSDKLSGIHRKPIWINKSKLYKPNKRYKYPKAYDSLIVIDKR